MSRPLPGRRFPVRKLESRRSVAKRAGFILCLVVCALGVGAGHARADTPPTPASDRGRRPDRLGGRQRPHGRPGDCGRAGRVFRAGRAAPRAPQLFGLAASLPHGASGRSGRSDCTHRAGGRGNPAQADAGHDARREVGEDAGRQDVSRARRRHAAPAEEPPVLRQRPSGSRPAAVPDAHADPRRDLRRHAHRDRRAAADSSRPPPSRPSR